MHFITENDTISSLSTPQNEERRISKGKVEITHEHQEKELTQIAAPELDINAFFSDYLELREQEDEQVEEKTRDDSSEPITEEIVLPAKPASKQRRVNHSKKATESIKKIVRLFRKYIKDSEMYNSKQIEAYFTCSRFTFSNEAFQSNLGIFQELTCCSKEKAVSENYDDLKLLYIVFNKSPSKGNLNKFFQIPIISDLWWGSEETTQR